MALFIIAIVLLPGEALTQGPAARQRTAVLPAENLSGKSAPLEKIRSKLTKSLQYQQIVEEEPLKDFMAKHRLRYTGGIDAAIAKAFKEEINADSVLITSVELYDENYPAKVALTSRLVATGENPVILWMDSVGLAGDDSPGILGLGLIKDPNLLVEKAAGRLAGLLNKYLSGETEKLYDIKTAKKFFPRFHYRSPLFDPQGRHTIAVAPFFNESSRKNAGTFLMLQFARHLHGLKNFSVIEPGVVRQKLLERRVIMEDGISLAQADDLFSSLDVDLVLSGKVLEYQDYWGPVGSPQVDFSVIIVERDSREVVWSSKSYVAGDKGVMLFNWGKIRTAHALASETTKGVTARMAK